MTFRELYNLFQAWNQLNRAPRTAQFYAEQLDRVLKLHGDVQADQLRPQHLLPFKATWHLILAVQRIYRWAIEQDLVADTTVLRLKRPRLGRRRRVLSRRDMLRLLRTAKPDFRLILLAYRETAARPIELRQLEWSALCVPEGVGLSESLRQGTACFVLENFKGRARRKDEVSTRVIPISPRLGRLLLRLLDRREGGKSVFVSGKAKPWTYCALRCRMRKLRVRAGLPFVVAGEKACLYHLRHATATQWVAAGMQLNACSELLGHSRVQTTQRYVHLSRAQLIEAWKRHQQSLR